MGKSYFTGALPEYWLFALGGLFVVVTLFLPKGIVGLIAQIRAGTTKRNSTKLDRQSAGAEAGQDPSTIDAKPNPEPAE